MKFVIDVWIQGGHDTSTLSPLTSEGLSPPLNLVSSLAVLTNKRWWRWSSCHVQVCLCRLAAGTPSSWGREPQGRGMGTMSTHTVKELRWGVWKSSSEIPHVDSRTHAANSSCPRPPTSAAIQLTPQIRGQMCFPVCAVQILDPRLMKYNHDKILLWATKYFGLFVLQRQVIELWSLETAADLIRGVGKCVYTNPSVVKMMRWCKGGRG